MRMRLKQQRRLEINPDSAVAESSSRELGGALRRITLGDYSAERNNPPPAEPEIPHFSVLRFLQYNAHPNAEFGIKMESHDLWEGIYFSIDMGPLMSALFFWVNNLQKHLVKNGNGRDFWIHFDRNKVLFRVP